MADAEQLWINVIYEIFGVITKENFNQSYSAPRCAGGNCTALVLIDRRLLIHEGSAEISLLLQSMVKLAIATGHAMQVFNDLHYSNRCRLIGMAWPVAMVVSLPLNTVQNHIIYKR
jgi:hypothetical protein